MNFCGLAIYSSSIIILIILYNLPVLNGCAPCLDAMRMFPVLPERKRKHGSALQHKNNKIVPRSSLGQLS
jgi:hypothetical protein